MYVDNTKMCSLRAVSCIQLVALTHIYFHMKMYGHPFGRLSTLDKVRFVAAPLSEFVTLRENLFRTVLLSSPEVESQLATKSP